MSETTFPEELKARAERILTNYPEKQAALLPILHLFQERDGCIVDGVAETVAGFLSVPLMKVREVLSFYSLYAKRPRGKHHIQVCRTLTCSLLGGEKLGSCLGKKLGIAPGDVTANKQFSYEMVECLGACEMAPMLRFDKEYVAHVDEAKLDRMIGEHA